MKTMTLTVCGFYVKHENLPGIQDLEAQHCLKYTSVSKERTHALDNMSGEITLNAGSREATMKQGDNQFSFTILSVTGLSLPGQNETYPELQFGSEEDCEFRLITKPDINVGQINTFIQKNL